MSETKHPYETPRGECSELPPPMNHSPLSASYFQNRVANTGNVAIKQEKAAGSHTGSRAETMAKWDDVPSAHYEFPGTSPSKSCSEITGAGSAIVRDKTLG